MPTKNHGSVVLPPLHLNRIEFDLLDRLAKARSMDVAHYIESLVRDVIEDKDDNKPEGTIVVLDLPNDTYKAFAMWVALGDESPEDCICRFVAHEGEKLADMLAKLGKK